MWIFMYQNAFYILAKIFVIGFIYNFDVYQVFEKNKLIKETAELNYYLVKYFTS